MKLVHFKRHKRKTLKETPGKTINYPFDKPEENHPPGKDSTKKISNIIGKAANFAGSAKSKKVIRNHVMQLLTFLSIVDIMIISFKMATTGQLKNSFPNTISATSFCCLYPVTELSVYFLTAACPIFCYDNYCSAFLIFFLTKHWSDISWSDKPSHLLYLYLFLKI